MPWSHDPAISGEMNRVIGGGVWGLKLPAASILWLKYGESTLKSKLTQAVSSRRVFMMQVAAVTGVMGGLTAAHAADMVKEDDAQAKSCLLYTSRCV